MSDNTPDYQAILAGWWDEAERHDAKAGDLVIQDRREQEGGFDVFPLDGAMTEGYMASHNYRVLTRATPPKPAWQKAIAVMASTESYPGRDAWTRDPAEDVWQNYEGEVVGAEDLIDPVPLIEARVDDAAERVRDYFRTNVKVELPRDASVERAIATAALGIGDDA